MSPSLWKWSERYTGKLVESCNFILNPPRSTIMLLKATYMAACFITCIINIEYTSTFLPWLDVRYIQFSFWSRLLYTTRIISLGNIYLYEETAVFLYFFCPLTMQLNWIFKQSTAAFGASFFRGMLHNFVYIFLIFNYLVYVYWVYVSWYLCRSQMTTWESRIFPDSIYLRH